jgi:protein-S-isoprenylcysteine O-methyltransferase Ste14
VVAPGPRLPRWLPLIALPFVAAGALLNVRALDAFRRHGTPMDPAEQPRALVVDGPYRRTRNPMYLAGILILLGLALATRKPLALAVVPLYVLLATLVFVPSDERRMASLFGDEWRAYAGRVRRWI